MSPSRELWAAIVARLNATTAVTTLVDRIYDKADEQQWAGVKQAVITKGPVYGSDESADCVDSQEITIQIDVWTRGTRRSLCDDVVHAVRRALNGASLPLTEFALAGISVVLWRVMDDPDPLTQHGVIQVSALIEEPA